MSTEKFKWVMIIPHLTRWTLHYIFSSLSLCAKPGPSAPLKADLTGAGIGRWEVQLSKLSLWPGDAVARHKTTNIRVSGHTAPVQRPSGSDPFYCWMPYRHHHRNGLSKHSGTHLLRQGGGTGWECVLNIYIRGPLRPVTAKEGIHWICDILMH